MSKVGVIIEARVGSSRLPSKVLLDLWNSKPMLRCLLERFLKVFPRDSLIIATTNQPQDAPIVELAAALGVHSFRGSEYDVLDRVYRAARYHDLDVIAEITGDNPFADPWICMQAIDEYRNSNMILCSTDLHWHDQGYQLYLPIGLGFKIFDFNALRFIWRSVNRAVDREHVINGMMRMANIKKINWKGATVQQPEKYRLTVDFPEDLAVARAVALRCTNTIYAHYSEIISTLTRSPDLRQLNSNCTQTKYSEKLS